MLMFYDAYYRKFGIRKIDKLMAPVMPSTMLLELPQSSIYHYLGSNSLTDQAPSSNEYLFRHITKPIMMEHVVSTPSMLGMPRRQQIQMQPHLRTYHTRNHRYKLVKDFTPYENQAQTLAVVNYGFIAAGLKYSRQILSPYFAWYNQQVAVWDKIAQLADESVRHQFIKFGLPTVLPAMSDLKMAQAKFVQNSMKHLHEPNAWFILEVWKWLGDFRQQSLLAKIPDDKLHKVNIIFEETGRWVLVNLGLLDEWRKATKEELKQEPGAKDDGIDAHQLQRRFLHMLMMLFQARSVDGKVMGLDADAKKASGGEAPSPGGDGSHEDSITTQSKSLPSVNPQTGTTVLKTEVGSLPVKSDEDILNQDHDDTIDVKTTFLTPEQEARLNANLQELERISKAVAEKREQEMGEILEDEGQGQLVMGATPAKKPVVVPKQQKELKTLATPQVENHPVEHDYTAGVHKVVARLTEQGMLSAGEAKRYQELAKKHESIAAPDGKGSLKDFIKIEPETVKIASPAIPDQPTILDKTMLHSSLHVFDSKYIKDVLPKDVAAMVMNIQNAGICVTEYEVEHVESVMGDYDIYTARVVPIEGAPSTLRWKLPAVQEDGVYVSNGVRYRMRKQKGDMPLRKIAPDIVALTSYYGKLFISRSEKKVNDYGNWLRNQVMAIGLDETKINITGLQPANVFDNEFEQPRMYSILAQGFRSFHVNLVHLKGTPLDMLSKTSLTLNFDHTKREALFGKELVKSLEKDGAIVVGVTDKKAPVVMSKTGALVVMQVNAKPFVLPDFEVLIGADSFKAPVDFAEMKVLGRNIPLGVVLGYEMGLDKLIEFVNAEVRRVPAGKRVGLLADEYSLVFADETLVFKKTDRFASLILAGFNEYHRSIKQYSVYEFDKRGVYLNVLESGGASARYLREIDLLGQLFIDPITRELLVEMKEPTELQPLLIRAAELLLSDQHPRELDASYMRIKGYERLAGAVYSELVKAIRMHNGRAGKSKQPIDLHPFAIWTNISEDPSKAQVKDINPIENLKQQEAVTYSGVGGRNSRSMTKHTRAYDVNDMGTISESTVDSSDVAVNTYTSADPQFVSLRGVSKRYEIGKTGATALLSTSALVSVAADRDDPKRVNFIGIQHGHGVACAGYHANAVRTGYEQVVAHRTSDLFAFTAKKPGKVISLDEKGMVVEYDDGEKKGIELGRRYGNAEGATIPHDVRAAVKLGQKFKAGDLLSYNEGFFEQDTLNPNQVVWKAGVTVRVALMESTLTLEDSSAISKKAAELLKAKTTKTRTIILDFQQSVSKLVKVGQAVESGDILCVIEDATTAKNDLFDEESLDTLRVLQAQTPLAKAAGIVERIEVFYHGEKQDMSESLRSLANASDREMMARYRAIGRTAMNGQVDESFRSDGDALNLDTVAIKIYITSDVAAGVGDKGVFGNQMKTVFGKVLEHEVTTESGLPVEAIFGQKSIFDRIVSSPEIIGTTTTLLRLAGERAVKAYKS
jgi:hypothetical protein